MARLRILELPAGRAAAPAFAVIIDQADEQITAALAETDPPTDASGSQQFQSAALRPTLAQQLGARAVLAFEGTIDLPGNEEPADSDDSPPTIRVRIEPDFDDFREQVQQEATAANNVLAGARYARGKYSDQQPRSYDEGGHAARENGREAFARAIGMAPISTWDDMQKQVQALRDSLRNATERLDLARDALLADGYFAPREIGDDIAPRITELLTHRRNEHAEFPAALRDALGLDNDPSINLVQAARALRAQNDQAQGAVAAVHAIHQPVQHRGTVICGHCSDHDGTEHGTTDSAPVPFPCDTVRALDTKPDTTKPEQAGPGRS